MFNLLLLAALYFVALQSAVFAVIFAAAVFVHRETLLSTYALLRRSKYTRLDCLLLAVMLQRGFSITLDSRKLSGPIRSKMSKW